MPSIEPDLTAPAHAVDPRAVHVVAGVIRDSGGRVLLSRRAAKQHQGGLWEFPGGKVAAGETAITALHRELYEELGIECLAARPLIALEHDYGDRRIWLDVWQVDDWSGVADGREGQPIRWVEVTELTSVPMPAADVPVVHAVRLPSRYLITPEPAPGSAFLSRLEACVRNGESLLQLRAKSLDRNAYVTLAREAIQIAHSSGSRILLNSDAALVEASGADGVHLTSVRLLASSHRPLPATKWVAASCHSEFELRHAARIGVDFVVVGPVRASASHPAQDGVGWEAFRDLAGRARVPVYAIGGMRIEDLQQVWQAGGQGIAAIRGLWPDEKTLAGVG